MYQRAILIPPQLILIYNPMEGELLLEKKSTCWKTGLQGENSRLKGRRIRRGVLVSSWTLVRRNKERIVPIVVLVEEIRDVLSQKDYNSSNITLTATFYHVSQFISISTCNHLYKQES
jgi:hypothetical protein